jgi:hypothetical protein
MPSRRRSLRALLTGAFAIACLLSLVPAAGAQTTSTVTGRVTDASGALLPGVVVTARNVETGVVRTVITATDGRYTFGLLPVGRYELRAELPGFRPLVRQGVQTTVAETIVIDLTLALGGVTEEVRVSGGTPGVNTSTSELSFLVSGATLESLPLNGRNYTDLALLQPGVLPYPHRDGGSVVAHGLGMSVNGQDPRANVYLLDGTLLNDFTNGPAGRAAATTLGLETVREFRVETNAYSAEFGRNAGGQVNVLTKSGANQVAGSSYYFHRNDALDARNFFDTATKPDFFRHQFGATIGGPLRQDRLFYFAGYEGLREKLGRTISTFVPDDNARLGLLPSPSQPGQLIAVGVHPAVAPYLNEYPRANGPSSGGGIAQYAFGFDQRLKQDFLQGRVDYNVNPSQQAFARFTFDDGDQDLPTDYPQFPRAFRSRNQFFTGEHRWVLSPATLNTLRLGFSRTRVGQTIEANTSSSLAPFVEGRLIGNIDIGGLQRFGPQTSGSVTLTQNVFGLHQNLVHTRGRHMIKAGSLVEYYQMNLFNPTFANGIYNFPNLRSFLENRPALFIGLTPDGQLDRYWRSTLLGGYLQDEWQLSPRLTVNGGLRVEWASEPEEKYGRDVAMPSLQDREPTIGRLYQNPGASLSPRGGFAWNVTGDGRTSLRGGYGLYFNTNNQQNLIVTITNPPFTPRPVIGGPTFPSPPFTRAGAISIRPMQLDLEYPRVHVWNVSLQRDLPWQAVATISYAASRGRHLLRSNDVNTAVPTTLADGTPFFPAGTPRQNTAFSTIELKSSDGDSWYKAMIVDVRRRFSQGLAVQSSYTWSRAEDTTQASTFFSDATNGTTTAFPEFIPDYNKGLSDFHVEHSWVLSLTWEIPFARDLGGVARAVLDGWQVSGIAQARSGNPLTVFVAGNRSRSQWAPSLGPGIGRDRASYAPGRTADDAVIGRPDQWFDATAFVTPAAGTFGDTGRGDFVGPDLRTVDLSLTKRAAWRALGDSRLEFRIEAFNVLNHANFAPPNLSVYAGAADVEPPLPNFGRIRSTVTSARQIQLGVRMVF